jgi:anaerobic ribonucleoside-triphosphate reductase activating protein
MQALRINHLANRFSKELRIGGLTPLTTIDYPNHLSCVIYTQGCSWRCRYCHNPELVYAKGESSHSWMDILNFLKKRQGLLEAVVFCGGEPLLQNGLFDAMRDVKKLGFKIALHTAGSLPRKLNKVLSMIDWVGFDVKDLPDHVDEITQIKGSGESNWQSLEMLIDSGIDFQCRTTVHWQLIDVPRLIKLTQKLYDLGVRNYSIQFSRTDHMLDTQLGYSVLAKQKLEYLKLQLKAIMPDIKFS